MFVLSIFSLLGLTLSGNNVMVNLKNDLCSCHQIVSQLDCTLANRCIWDSTQSSCKTLSCSSILDQYSCSMTSTCYWNINTLNCTDFNYNTDCTKFTYTNTTLCYQQNIFCTNSTSAPTGSCTSRTTVTSAYTSCNSITTSSVCAENGLACKWEPAAQGQGSCQQITCSNLRTQQDCLYYSNSTSYKTLFLCTWVNDNCIPATTQSVESYSYNDCFLNTLGTYTFSSNTINDQGNFVGTCQSCYQYIISALVAIFALFI